MSTRTFALIWGIIFLAAAAGGLIPGLLQPAAGDHNVAVDAMHGDVLGLFPVNILHTLVHALFGVWGLLASRSTGAARNYARIVAVSYLVLAVFGLIPALDTLFGLVPLYGNDVWLHLALAIPAAYFGFVNRDSVVD